MRWHYKTATATLVQFIATAGLNFMTGAISILHGCQHSAGADCVTNAFVSLLLIILMAFGLLVLLAIGYLAQYTRNSRLAYLLIAGEAFAALIFLFDAKHAPGAAEQIANLIAALLAGWTIVPAWNLAHSRGNRIVTGRSKRVLK